MEWIAQKEKETSLGEKPTILLLIFTILFFPVENVFVHSNFKT